MPFSNYGAMSSSLQGFNDGDNSFKGSFYSSRTANNVMNSSNYSMQIPRPYMSYSQTKQMSNSGYRFGASVASNSNGFYPTAVSTPAYDKNNPNAKITSKAEEMMKRAEEMSKIYKPEQSDKRGLAQVK